MIRGCNDDGVDVLPLFEQFAVVRIALGALVGLLELLGAGQLLLLHLLHAGGLLGCRGRTVGASGPASHWAGPCHPIDLAVNIAVIDIAHGDHLLTALDQLAGVCLSLPPTADEGKVHRVTRGLVASTAQDVARNDHRTDGRTSRARNELPSRHLLFAHFCSLKKDCLPAPTRITIEQCSWALPWSKRMAAHRLQRTPRTHAGFDGFPVIGCQQAGGVENRGRSSDELPNPGSSAPSPCHPPTNPTQMADATLPLSRSGNGAGPGGQSMSSS